MAALRPCGTAAAYRRHLRRGEPACSKCKAAHCRKNSEHRRIHGRPSRAKRQKA